ncbi:MAG: TetR/AcrR family transcriptional regulator, partial [Ancrocorticia sp.]
MEQKGSSHKRRRPGRPVGDSCTRDAILDASLEMFAANGYDGASVRAIAERAGVDPGLIRHFFSDKAGLFMATMADRTQISQKIAGSLHGDPSSVGERLADTYLALWEDEETRPVLLALARSATSSERAAALLLDVMKARLGDGQSGSMTVGMALASS